MVQPPSDADGADLPMGVADGALSLESLGPSPQAAIRLLLRTFRNRGWRDDGSATAIVRLLESRRFVTPRAAAREVTADFLATNAVTRSTVQAALKDLGERSGRVPPS